jgi:hypothetical protein
LTIAATYKLLVADTTDCTGANTGSFQVDGGGHFAKSVLFSALISVGDGSGAGVGGVIINRDSLPYVQFQAGGTTLCFLVSSAADTIKVLTSTAAATGNLQIAKINAEDDVSLTGGKYFYLRGSSGVDGSVRLSSQSAGTAILEKRASGSWSTLASW